MTDPKNTSSQAERLYAVLVGEKQVVVLPEAIDCESSPGKARFEVSETPQSSKPIAVTVDLAALLEAEIDGKEWIEADRAER